MTHDNTAIEFAVPGRPQPQGSKTARVVGRRVWHGSQAAVVDPKAIVVELADMATKTQRGGRLKKWREAVRLHALVAMRGHDVITTPVALSAEFLFARPRGHWLATGGLRKGALTSPTIDLSKLVRAIEDAMTSVVYRDDSLVVRYADVSKRWCKRPQAVGGVKILVRPL